MLSRIRVTCTPEIPKATVTVRHSFVKSSTQVRHLIVVPAGWQVCPCQPADIRLSVRLLTRSCLYASQSWHLNAAVLVTGVSGSFCDVKVFALTTSGFTASINLMA